MFSASFTLTKRHLGWLLLIGGVVSFAGIFSLDLIAIARQGGLGNLFTAETFAHLRSPLGIGPAQRLALGVSAAAALVGLTLLPLGDRPA
jgi:hypothetical protein